MSARACRAGLWVHALLYDGHNDSVYLLMNRTSCDQNTATGMQHLACVCPQEIITSFPAPPPPPTHPPSHCHLKYLNPFTAPARKISGLKVHRYTLANSIFAGPIRSLLSVLCILIQVLSGAHTKGWKNITISGLALLSVVFRVMAWQAWQ